MALVVCPTFVHAGSSNPSYVTATAPSGVIVEGSYTISPIGGATITYSATASAPAPSVGNGSNVIDYPCYWIQAYDVTLDRVIGQTFVSSGDLGVVNGSKQGTLTLSGARLGDTILITEAAEVAACFGLHPSLDSFITWSATTFNQFRYTLTSNPAYAQRLGPPRSFRQPKTLVHDPVSVTTGAFYETDVDLNVNGPFPIEIGRTYSSSNSAAMSEFGFGWLSGYASYLAPSPDPSVIQAADADGSVIVFRRQGAANVWVPTVADNPGLVNSSGGAKNLYNASITEASPGNFQWRSADGSIRNYVVHQYPVTSGDITYARERPYLTSWLDNRGNSLSFSYGANPAANDYGRINLIQSSNGTSVSFTYDADGHITVAAAADGRTVNYTYNFVGDLVSVQRPDGSTFAYAYDGSTHLLTEKVQPGGRILQNDYDDFGRVVRQRATVDPANPTTPVTNATFDYSVAGQTTVKDAYGNPTVYQYTAGGLMTKITDPLGQSVTQDWYDATGGGAYINSLRSVTDKRGLVTTYRYDSQGNTIQTQITGDLTGNQGSDTATTTAVFNSLNLPVTVTDASGITTTYTYANPSYPYFPTQVSTSKGGTPLRTDTLTYVAVGSPPAFSNGLLSSRTSAVGSSDQAVTQYEYNAAGYMTRQTAVTGNSDPNVVTVSAYNTRGELTSVTDGDGRSVNYTYDAMSRTTSKVIKDEQGNVLGTWTMSYTANGELSRTVGARTSPADTVERTYDAAGRLEEEDVTLSQAKPDGSGVTATQSVARTSYGHDLFGNLVLTIDPLENVTTMTYDAVGQLLTRNTAGLRTESLQYEPGGKVAQYTNPLGGVTRTYYTTTGQPRRQENPDGSVLEWRYYADGRLQQEILRNGTKWTTVYDDAARTITRTLTKPNGDPLATGVSVYDRRGNLVSFTDPEGFVKTAIYDALDRVTSSTGPAGTTGSPQQTTTTAYGASGKTQTVLNGLGEKAVTTSDALGRPVQTTVRDAADAIVRTTSYAYSADHNAVTITEGSGPAAIARSVYTDTFNRPVLTVLGDGSYTRNAYDLNGNLITSVDALGQATSYAYNALNQVTTQTLPDGSVTTFTYDSAGNLLTRGLANGTLTQEQTYDNAGRKLTERLYSGSTNTRQYSYAYYDAAGATPGLLYTVTTPRDVATTTYDDFMRPSTVTTAGALPETNGTTTYTYDRRNLLTAVDQSWVNNAAGPATHIGRTYDGYRQLRTETVTGGASTYATIAQTWDAAGRRTSLDEATSTLPAPLFTYQQRADGQLTQVTANAQTYNFNYANNGLLTGRTNPFRTLSVTMRDAAGRLQEQTQTVGGTSVMAEDMIWRSNSTLSSYTANRSDASTWDESRLYSYNARGQLLDEGFSPATGMLNALKFQFDGANPGLGIRLGARIGTGAPASWETIASANSLGRVTSDQTGPASGRGVAATGTATGADHVDIAVDGAAQGRAAYTPGTGAWSLNLDLAAGMHTLAASAIDPSGLYRTTANSTFTITAALIGEQTGTLLSAYDDDGNVITRTWSNGVTQTLTWDAFGRLIKVAQRDGSNNGYDWSATYDGLGRRLRATQQPVVGNAASGSATSTTSIYDPMVEFLEIGVAVDGARAWKVYGPDLNGSYGGLQGTGGLEATIVDTTKATKGVLNDHFGNGVASISGTTVNWFVTRVGAYGPLPGTTTETLTDINRVAEATVWRSRRLDPTGFYNLGARYYEPTTGRFLSADPMGHSASPSLYDFCNGDPVNFFDPDGRVGKNQSEDQMTPFVVGAKRWTGADELWYQEWKFKRLLDEAYDNRMRRLVAEGWPAPESDWAAIERGFAQQNGLLNYGADKFEKAGWFAIPGGSAIEMGEGAVGLFQLGRAGLKAGIGFIGKRLGAVAEEGGGYVSSRGMVTSSMGEEFIGVPDSAGAETYFRTMSQAHYDQLLATGQLPATAETFISPSLRYASEYEGVTVQFTLKGGTTDSLLEIGVRNAGLRGATFESLPLVRKGWTASNAFFKLEGDVINVGLGRGSALKIFNENIVTFGLPK